MLLYIYFIHIYIYSVAQRWCSLCNIRILVWLWGSFTLAGGQRVDCTDGPAFGSFLTRSFFLSLSSSSVFLWPSPSHFPALFLPVLLSCSSTVFSLPLYVALLVILSLSLFFQSLSLYLSLSLSLPLSLDRPFTPSISVVSSLLLTLSYWVVFHLPFSLYPLVSTNDVVRGWNELRFPWQRPMRANNVSLFIPHVPPSPPKPYFSFFLTLSLRYSRPLFLASFLLVSLVFFLLCARTRTAYMYTHIHTVLLSLLLQ